MMKRTLVMMLLGTAVACGRPPADTGGATSAAPPALPASAAVPRYDSTLQDGIKFYQPGLPAFLEDMSGVSVHESWGRWTDGPVAVLKFTEPLPLRFTLVITGAAYGPNLGRPATFVVGNVSQQATFSAELGKGDPDVRRLDFVLAAPADRIEIRPPQPQSSGADGRQLGLALIQATLEPHR